MLHRSGVTQRLARFVVGTRWDDIPSPVRHQAKRSLMNFFAVALAGCRTAPVEIALRSLAEFSGGKQATIVGRTERIDVLSAAFLNAAGANVHDFCDTHLRTVIHPTAPVAPALLALAELRQVSGPDLLLALERVVVRGNPLLSDRTDRPDVSTGRESQVSVQHAVAAALATGQRASMSSPTPACAMRTCWPCGARSK